MDTDGVILSETQFRLPKNPDDVMHVTCCAVNDPGVLAMCGVDVGEERWEVEGDDKLYAECRPCKHLSEKTDFCPHLGRCP